MTAIEITFLGTTAAIPTPERNHPSIYLRYIGRAEYCMLFDCGEGAQRQIFRAKLNFMKINQIFITHWHADHFAGLLGLFETMSLEKRRDPLFVYGPEAERFVDILKRLGYGFRGFEIIAKDVSCSNLETVLDNEEYNILSAPVNHGIPAVAYAFVEKDRIKIDKQKLLKYGLPEKGSIFNKLKREGSINYKGKKIMLKDVSFIERGKKVVYSGDTKACKNLIKISEGADVLILDCTYFENSVNEKLEGRYHMNLDKVIEIGKQTKAKQLFLTHISRRYQNHSELESKVMKKAKNIKVAKDFMTIKIN